MSKIVTLLCIALFGLYTTTSAMGLERFIWRPAGTSYEEGAYSDSYGLQLWKQLPVYHGTEKYYMDTDVWNVEVIKNGSSKSVKQRNVWLRFIMEPKYNKEATVMQVAITKEKTFAILEVKQYDNKGILYKDCVVKNPIFYDIEPGSVFEALNDLYFHYELKNCYGDQRVNDGTGTPGMAYSPYGINYAYTWWNKN